MLIDSHCHLDLMEHVSPETAVAIAAQQGVAYLLSVSVDVGRFPALLTIAQQLDNVFISAGVHPNSREATTTSIETLCYLADNDKVIAIGETGLDYFRSQGDLTWQHERFRTHIRAAKQVRKPLIIHTRDAAPDTLKILREEEADKVGGVMHCFSEDWTIAQQALDLGFYISFSGIVTFRSARILQEVAKQVPANRFLIETDSPYLAPVPHRGKPNQPAYVRYVAECLAQLRGEPIDTIARCTTENFFRLFRPVVH